MQQLLRRKKSQLSVVFSVSPILIFLGDTCQIPVAKFRHLVYQNRIAQKRRFAQASLFFFTADVLL